MQRQGDILRPAPTWRTHIIAALLLASLVAGCGGRPASARRIPTQAELDRLRRAGGLMTWAPAEQRLGYPNIEKIADTALVRRSPKPLELRRAPRDLSRFRYSHGATDRTVDGFMDALKVVGLIAVKDGAIVLERYADGHDADTAWTAFSVVKSVTSLLYGVALKNGHIRSLDEPVTRYLPELAGSAYDGVTLRHMLQMSSGITWNSNLVHPASRPVVAMQSYWPKAYADELIEHNDAFVAALIAALR